MTRKILAIDDSKTMRGILKQVLSRAGYDVSLAEDGEDGLSCLENDVPHLIITDINMPRLDGFGLIEEVRRRKHLRALPILVLTTETAAELKDRAWSAGATGWIVKPFDEDKLVGAIRMVVA
jgi:two-component system chemotaxis response regulator CheY